MIRFVCHEHVGRENTCILHGSNRLSMGSLGKFGCPGWLEYISFHAAGSVKDSSLGAMRTIDPVECQKWHRS